MEIAGLVLGGIPLAISAIEYYPKAKKLGRYYYRFRRTHTKEVLRLKLAREVFELHLQALLQPLLACAIVDSRDIADLLVDPGGPGWKEQAIEEALDRRLAGKFGTYRETLRGMEDLMGRLLKAVKVEDTDFQQYILSDASPNPDPAFKARATIWCKKIALQPRIAIHVLGSQERESLLEELDTDIRNLKELLDAADGVTKFSAGRVVSRNHRMPTSLRGFWTRAMSIWQLINQHMLCQCQTSHCARLWLDKETMARASLDLGFIFDKYNLGSASPWRQPSLRVQQAGTSCSCSGNPQTHQLPNLSFGSNHLPTTPAISIQGPGQSSAPTGPAAPLTPHHIAIHGLCATMHAHHDKRTCLGALTCNSDGCEYHFMPNRTTVPYGFVPLSAILHLGLQSSFRRIPRIKLAAALTAAHLRYHQTPWTAGSWTAQSIFFPIDATGTGQVRYDLPYIISDFSQPPPAQTTARSEDHGFWTLGIVLLELCFGHPLETHEMWSNSPSTRDPTDPFHRKAVAVEWAKTVEQEIDGPQYTRAVNWCLLHSPTYVTDDSWREEFVINVLGPLQEYTAAIS